MPWQAPLQGVLDGGVAVPGQMAFVGYDYYPWAEALPVPLTTVEQPMDALADKTIALVRYRLEHPHAPWRHETLRHALVARASG